MSTITTQTLILLILLLCFTACTTRGLPNTEPQQTQEQTQEQIKEQSIPTPEKEKQPIHPEADASIPEQPKETGSLPEVKKEGETKLPDLRDGMKLVVRKVVDGDTVYAYPQNSRKLYYKIRLWGFNAPECYKGRVKGVYTCKKDQEYFGLKAQVFLSSLLPQDAEVIVSCPTKEGKLGQQCKVDPYRRFLAFLLQKNGTNTSIRMLQEGFGWVYTIFYPPLLKELCSAEASAIKQKKGMWTLSREEIKNKMNSSTRNWYYHKTSRKSHDSICTDALGESFSKLAGEIQ